MPAMPGSKVFTNTPLVHEARLVVLVEFELSSLTESPQGRSHGVPPVQSSTRLSYL